jgi:hypothetical protein
MTAKEKAKELVDKYSNIEIQTGGQYDGYISMIKADANQCALIACEEVLGYMGADRGTEFWQEVKREIEKL